MRPIDAAQNFLKALGEQGFTEPFASDMGEPAPASRRRPPASLKVNNPKVPAHQRDEDDSTYDFSVAGEHPLRGLEGAHGEGASFGSSPEEVGPTMQDPKLRTVSQEEFEEDKESLDTSTPFNPFKKKSYAFDAAWTLLKGQETSRRFCQHCNDTTFWQSWNTGHPDEPFGEMECSQCGNSE